MPMELLQLRFGLILKLCLPGLSLHKCSGDVVDGLQGVHHAHMYIYRIMFRTNLNPHEGCAFFFLCSIVIGFFGGSVFSWFFLFFLFFLAFFFPPFLLGTAFLMVWPGHVMSMNMRTIKFTNHVHIDADSRSTNHMILDMCRFRVSGRAITNCIVDAFIT